MSSLSRVPSSKPLGKPSVVVPELAVPTEPPVSALPRVDRAAEAGNPGTSPLQSNVSLEALTCAKCRSINVEVVFARDYCLKCRECGKFSPLAYACQLCGKHATVRKRRDEFYRACDGVGGCGKSVVFWRAN